MPVANQTAGSTVAGALQDEGTRPTKRIKLTNRRDMTMTTLCLPLLDPCTEVVGHTYVMDSATVLVGWAQKAYIIKMRLDNLSTVWKAHVSSIHPKGICGKLLGERCGVAPDGHALQQRRQH